jgi:hypothetical protein
MSLTQSIYEFLYNGLDLKTVGIFVGLVLLVFHLAAFFQYEKLTPFLKALPRNTRVGTGVLAVCFVWAIIIWKEMDLGEFYNLERPVLLILVVGFFAVSHYVKEFLAVRAIGFFLILAAAPVLHAAFLEPPVTRLLLVALAYAWILVGFFWVGMPYLMRDQINWALADSKRWKMVTLAGAVYGALVFGCALAFY